MTLLTFLKEKPDPADSAPDIVFEDNVKDKIFEFVEVFQEGSGIKEHRQYFYYERLLILSEILEEKILNPSKQDVLNAISELRDRTTRGMPHILHPRYRISKRCLKS